LLLLQAVNANAMAHTPMVNSFLIRLCKCDWL
jgi:hypothetical protein